MIRSNDQYVWLVGWLVGWSIGRSVGRSLGWLVGQTDGRSVGLFRRTVWLILRSFDRRVSNLNSLIFISKCCTNYPSSPKVNDESDVITAYSPTCFLKLKELAARDTSVNTATVPRE